MSDIIEFKSAGYGTAGGFRFRGLNFSIPGGETVVAVNSTRDEESVMPKLCAGLVPLAEGEIKLFGKNLSEIPQEELLKLRSEKMGFVFSKPTLLNNMRVKDNVALPLRYHTELSEAGIIRTIEELFRLAGISAYEEKFPPELPAGIQKLVSVLRASVMNPEIIVYDDPVFDLDALASAPVIELIKKINFERKSAALIFTCRQETVKEFSGRAIKVENIIVAPAA